MRNIPQKLLNFTKTRWRSILFYTGVFIVVRLIFSFILFLTFVPSASMENAIRPGDVLIGTRLENDTINRYDIILFRLPDNPSTVYIKRVIGLPGEKIVVKDGAVFADGQELDDSFLKEEMITEGELIFDVPENSYFMMGDNRNDSYDSREWDEPFVSIDLVIGKATTRILPLHRIGKVR